MSKTIYIGGRLESKAKGNVVTGANAILDDTKGKKQNVINKETDDELARLEQSKQDNLNFDSTPTENSTNPVTSGGVYTAEKALSDAIEAILLLIPSAATALNKLVDTNTMNSSISTATATFRGTYNAVSDLGLTYQATHAQIEAALDALGLTADNNDYAFVQVPVSDQSQDIAKTERYKNNGTNWQYEYDLNTSGFTAAQWGAINSTITLALVQKLAALPTNAELLQALGLKQDVLTFDNAPTKDSNNPVKSGGIKNAIDTAAGDEATARENADLALAGLIGDEKTRAEGIEGGLNNRLGAVEGSVTTIQGVIPSGATSSNKMVDNNSMTTYIGTIIDNIDATFNVTSTDGHVTLAITQVNGVITSVQLTTTDIASAADLNLKASQADLTALAGRVSTNETDIANLQQLYNNLQQSKPEPVTALPSTGQQQGVIYRLAGTTSYSDYMWNGSTWVLMATYNNAIDNVPTAGSNNLVKSGGVYKELKYPCLIKWEEGGLDSSSGAEVVSSVTIRSFSIPYYYANTFRKNASLYCNLYFYEADGTYLGWEAFQDNNADNRKIPNYPTAQYFRVQLWGTTLDPQSISESEFYISNLFENNEVIENIDNRIKHLGSILEIKETIIDKSSANIYNGYIDYLNGSFIGNNNYKTAFIPIGNTKSIVINVSSDQSISAKYFAFFNADPEGVNKDSINGEKYDYYVGNTYVTVPNDATFIGIIVEQNGSGSLNNFTFYKEENIIDNIKDTETKIQNTTTENGYVNWEDGSFIPHQNFTTAFFSISDSDKIRIISLQDIDTPYVAFYTSLPSAYTSSINGVKYNYSLGETIINIPDNSQYVGITVKSTSHPEGSVGNITVYGIETGVTSEKLNDAIERIENLEQTSSGDDWSDLTWYVVGDSLTAHNIRAALHYYDYISEKTLIDFVVRGHNGQGYAAGDAFFSDFTSILPSYHINFATIFGSGNDIRYENVSSLANYQTWDDALGDPSDNGTMSICGYINRAIDAFYASKPLCKIGLVTPTPWKNGSAEGVTLTDAETHNRLETYSNAIVEICKNRGIPCLDLFHTSGLRPWNADVLVEYYKEGGIQDDGVHPNSKGQKWISGMFYMFIKQFLIDCDRY